MMKLVSCEQGNCDFMLLKKLKSLFLDNRRLGLLQVAIPTSALESLYLFFVNISTNYARELLKAPNLKQVSFKYWKAPADFALDLLRFTRVGFHFPLLPSLLQGKVYFFIVVIKRDQIGKYSM